MQLIVFEVECDPVEATVMQPCFSIFLRPSLSQLPLGVLAMIIVGAAVGAALAFPVAWITGIDWAHAFTNPYRWPAHGAVSGACYAVSFYLLGYLPIERFRLKIAGSRWSGAVYATFLVIAVGTGWCLSESRLQRIAGSGGHNLRRADRTRVNTFGLVVGTGACALILAARTAWLERRIRERALSEKALRAQMYALQAQINPHFFFNTLSTISALAEQDAGLTQRTIGCLARLFRYTLSCSQCEFVSLADELAFVRDYLAIEQVRLGSRLQLEWPDTETGAGVCLPGLTLQPVVENAIRHGIGKRVGGGVVRVQIRREMGRCVIEVSNQTSEDDELPDFSNDKAFRQGHALSNICERLQLSFHGEASFEIEANSPGWVHARVYIPLARGVSA